MNILINIIICKNATYVVLFSICNNYTSYNEASSVLSKISYILKLGTFKNYSVASVFTYLIMTNVYMWIFKKQCNSKTSKILVKLFNELNLQHMHYELWFLLTNNRIFKDSHYFSESNYFIIQLWIWH